MEQDRIEFYHTPVSPPSMVVACTLLLFKIDHADRQINLAKGEHLKKPYLQINPDGAVPSIKKGEFRLNEAISICRYLIETSNIDNPYYPYKDAKA
jgi:glutathione S-transferase